MNTAPTLRLKNVVTKISNLADDTDKIPVDVQNCTLTRFNFAGNLFYEWAIELNQCDDFKCNYERHYLDSADVVLAEPLQRLNDLLMRAAQLHKTQQALARLLLFILWKTDNKQYYGLLSHHRTAHRHLVVSTSLYYYVVQCETLYGLSYKMMCKNRWTLNVSFPVNLSLESTISLLHLHRVCLYYLGNTWANIICKKISTTNTCNALRAWEVPYHPNITDSRDNIGVRCIPVDFRVQTHGRGERRIGDTCGGSCPMRTYVCTNDADKK